jgi:SAM-dependent methyltransferase
MKASENAGPSTEMEATEEMVPYDRFFSLTAEGFRRYGSIFDLPVAMDPYIYLAHAYQQEFPNGKVLDFGCGADKALKEVLGIEDKFYFACDTDPSTQVSFRKLEEIPAELRFQVVSANQVLEHLPFANCIRTVMGLAGVVAPGGILLISVPNPQHPTRHLSNPTHITPLNYLNLYALMKLSGLETIHCARCNKVTGPRWYERPLVDIMCRVFRMDWCDTVYAVGKKAK